MNKENEEKKGAKERQKKMRNMILKYCKKEKREVKYDTKAIIRRFTNFPPTFQHLSD